jgi:hypothetical protein
MRAHSGTEFFRVDGHKMLAGYHRPAGPESRRHPTVLFLHGFPGSEKSVDIQRALMKKGIASVAPSFQGAWGSEGTYRFTTLVPQARAALRAARKLPFVNPNRVAVYGFSMGAWAALNLAALEPELKAVAAIAPAGGPEIVGPDTRQFLAHLSRALKAPAPDALLADFKRAVARFDPAKAVPRIQAPILFVHGDADDTIPVVISRRLASLAVGPVRLVIERGAAHDFLDRREQLTKLVSRWLAERI